MDYLRFFGIKDNPFQSAVNERFYYSSEIHTRALEKLRHIISMGQGLSVVIGPAGTGKTTLARKLLEELEESRYEAVLLVVINSSVSTNWLLRKFALQIGIEAPGGSRVEILGKIYQKVSEIWKRGKKTVLLVDEVQMLNSKEIMKEFRGLLNMEVSGEKLINFVFFGLPEVEQVLALDESLKQRVAMRIVLRPLSEEHTYKYVRHRLMVAGAGGDIFTDKALQRVYRYSVGIPRVINIICNNAMLEAFLRKKEVVDDEIIDTVAVDLGFSANGDMNEGEFLWHSVRESDSGWGDEENWGKEFFWGAERYRS